MVRLGALLVKAAFPERAEKLCWQPGDAVFTVSAAPSPRRDLATCWVHGHSPVPGWLCSFLELGVGVRQGTLRRDATGESGT